MRDGTAATSWTLGAVIGLTVYMPLYFQVVHKLSATEAGLALIPLVVMTTPGSMVSGRSMMHLRRYKVSAIAGAIMAIASVAVLIVWPALPLYGVVIALTLIGFGVGTVYPVATVSIQNAVPVHQVGTATGAMNFFRALASTLAVAVMGAILLAGLGATPQRGTGVELLVETAGAAGVDMAAVFRWLFVAADIFLIGAGRHPADGRASPAWSRDQRGAGVSRGSADASGIAPSVQSALDSVRSRTNYLLRTTSL
jgi:Na+/melibiose symporter-like transporter